jgi:hypothetical protein
MQFKEVTIIIDFKIYLYLFEPIIEYLLKNNVKVFLASSSEVLPQVKEVLEGLDITYIDYTNIKNRNKIRYGIHRACSILFTRADFSFQFQKKRQQSTKKFTGLQGKLLQLAKITPKIPNTSINSFLHKIASVGLKNPFPTEYIMAGSLNASAELLTAKGQKVITVMESWDHAVKEPNGYKSDLFLGWNQSLCDDWRVIQGDRNCQVLHPMKLRYGHETFSYSPPNNKRKRILYPVASTAKFSIGILVELEKKIIKELIDATDILGWELYIKPRPNGMKGEFDYAEAYEHVIVGEVSHGEIVNPANYFYSNEDNAKRFAALNEVDMVINAFTTFGLDAAVAGVPVLQLDLRESVGFEDSYLVYNNFHIKNYLINTDVLLRPQQSCLKEDMLAKEDELLSIAKSYTKNLQGWLYKYNSADEAIEECFGSKIK